MKKFILWMKEHPILTALGITALILGIVFLVTGNSEDETTEPEAEPIPDTPVTTFRTRNGFIPRSGFRTAPNMGNSGVRGARVNQGVNTR